MNPKWFLFSLFSCLHFFCFIYSKLFFSSPLAMAPKRKVVRQNIWSLALQWPFQLKICTLDQTFANKTDCMTLPLIWQHLDQTHKICILHCHIHWFYEPLTNLLLRAILLLFWFYYSFRCFFFGKKEMNHRFFLIFNVNKLFRMENHTERRKTTPKNTKVSPIRTKLFAKQQSIDAKFFVFKSSCLQKSDSFPLLELLLSLLFSLQ